LGRAGGPAKRVRARTQRHRRFLGGASCGQASSVVGRVKKPILQGAFHGREIPARAKRAPFPANSRRLLAGPSRWCICPKHEGAGPGLPLVSFVVCRFFAGWTRWVVFRFAEIIISIIFPKAPGFADSWPRDQSMDFDWGRKGGERAAWGGGGQTRFYVRGRRARPAKQQGKGRHIAHFANWPISGRRKARSRDDPRRDQAATAGGFWPRMGLVDSIWGAEGLQNWRAARAGKTRAQRPRGPPRESKPRRHWEPAPTGGNLVVLCGEGPSNKKKERFRRAGVSLVR